MKLLEETENNLLVVVVVGGGDVGVCVGGRQ